MTRCDYDTVFYRVFCVTLLAIAFTFTVILTNVFVDIDGLLASKKDKVNINTNPNVFTKYATDTPDNEEINYSESDDSYRTKRSIETQSYLFHIKNPKVKTILANKLSTLLEELEEEDSEDIRIKPEVKKVMVTVPKADDKPEVSEEIKKRDEMLHAKLHNIILQGIANHMDLNNVFKKIRNLKPKVEEFKDMKDGREPIGIGKEGENKLIQKPIEDRFLDEMLNCKDLHKQVAETATVKPTKDTPKVVIKTVIDITSENKDKENDTKILNENIQGDIELVYNGKIIKFKRSEAETPPPQTKSPAIYKLNPFKSKKDAIETTTPKSYDYNMVPRTYMDKFVEDYFKHFPHVKLLNNEINQHFETKRLKRHVRIKYENDKSGETKMKKNTEEDELYVEIETHFDSKGIKGEKKKKIIKNLIEKIQKAIHSDMTGKLAATNKKNDTIINQNKHRKRVHFRKRSQNPLKNINQVFIKRINSPFVQRELHPISKTVLPEQRIPLIDTKSEEWRYLKPGPGFLSNTKSINSAEMSELDVDYSKILEVNGIPQRLQQPLNTELSEETIKTNSYYDVGNSKYVVKGIDGSGFSVGFNQYVDSPPDQDAMRIFSGLENMIKTYHNIYDQTPMPETTTEARIDDEEIFNENSPYNEHTIERRSINNKHDYHSNKYKVIFDKNHMPFKSYHDVYNMKPKKAKTTPILEGNKASLLLDENIFEKKLKPSEILSLANLFQRKKRAVKIQKFLTKNVNRKTVSRFLNTNAMSTKTIFLNRKRNKRQINKIRIIATDMPQNYRQSGENVFVESDENIFADRALLKEREDSYTEHEKQEENDFMTYQNNEPNAYINKILKRRSRQNPLMSKYPHIFLEGAAKSGEEFYNPNDVVPTYLPEHSTTNPEEKINIEQLVTSTTNDTDFLKQLQEQELINTSIGSPANSNYKVTVKIIPKNESDLHSGFKEMHTTINKSFNKNGLLYSSLVNVSEISKVMNLNNTRVEAEKEEKEKNDKKFGNEEMFLSKSIYDQQEKMQFLLKEHARHISEQLNRLQQEKNNLEFILNGDNNTEIKYLRINPLSMHIEQQANVENNNEVAKMVEKTERMVLNDGHAPELNSPIRRQLAPSLIEATPLAPVTQLPSLPEAHENDIIKTIERNGNLTDQILKKIDRNTEILQLFLKKLAERIDTPHTSPKPEREGHTLPPDWGNQGLQYPHNMVVRKNDSHVSIPLTYAYPTPVPAKSKTQVANGIYQGHVRNFNVPNNQNGADKSASKISETKNKSRFFIDGIENDYKVIQLGDFNKNHDYNSNLIVNGTLS